jgi:hypothetical protein
MTTPTKPYSEIESTHIKQKLAERDFHNGADRDYINDLVTIEHHILNPKKIGRCGTQQLKRLKNKHPKDYTSIKKELKPEQFKEEKKREKEQKKRKRYKRRGERRLQARKEAKAQKDWKEVKDGG